MAVLHSLTPAAQPEVVPGNSSSLDGLWFQSFSANSKQHGNVLPHFREQRWLGFGMKLCVAACPIHAFEWVDQDGTFYLVDFDGQSERRDGLRLLVKGQTTASPLAR